MSSDDASGGQAGRSTLFGYAVLRANFDHDANSYMDNFSPFIMDVLSVFYPSPAEESSIADSVQETFGLTIPDRVVGRLLRKLVRKGKVVLVRNSAYQLANSAHPTSLREEMAKFQVSQTELISKFKIFVKENHPDGYRLIENDPGYHLQTFIERHAAPLLRRSVANDRSANKAWGNLNGPDYLVSAFVLHLEASDAAAFSYLIEAVKGAILLGVLQVPIGDIHGKLDKLTIVLDTPVLLSALGYEGEIPKRAAVQMLELADQLGVQLSCFEHTVKELDGVLEAAIAQLRSNRPVEDVRHSVYLHFLDTGGTPSDIALARENLAHDLKELNVKVIPIPEDYRQYGLDESALDQLFKDALPKQRESTRLYDLKSISAVHRLRHGSSFASLDLCQFLFVTDNSGLVVVGRRVNERHRWPLVMLDSEIASLLWVRSPAIADDLPKQQLVAAVYTAMQPPGYLWVKYVDEIERLEKLGEVNADEAVILRSIPLAREALMDVTLGESDKIGPESVELVVERVKENLSSPWKDQADHARAERDLAKKVAEHARHEGGALASNLQTIKCRLEALEMENRARAERLEKRANLRARHTTTASASVMAAILIIPGALTYLDPAIGKHLPPLLRVAFSVAGAVVVCLTAIQIFVPGSVADWLRPVERWLARHFHRRMKVYAGVSEYLEDQNHATH